MRQKRRLIPQPHKQSKYEKKLFFAYFEITLKRSSKVMPRQSAPKVPIILAHWITLVLSSDKGEIKDVIPH